MATTTTDPFAAMGGGVQVNGGWVPKSHPLAAQAPQQAAPPSGPGAAPGTSVPAPANQALQTPTTVGQTPQQGQQTSVAGAFQQALVNQLAPGAISAQSPEIAPAIAANRASEQRGLERGRAQLAEQAAQQGIDPNGFGSQLRGLQAESALRSGQFEGGAVQQLGRDRMNQLQSALSLSGSLLGDQDRMALQREMAQLQAQLQREGLGVQSSLGSGDLALRRDLGTGQLNLGLLGTLLSNQQFGQGLSSSNALGQAQLNQQAILALLGGG
jgi:hypothetical protein